MPKRKDIRSILIIGSGPIVIGQACEFDYSGTQALKALREEGYRTVLVNSNPATIMTDPEMADRTYIEPITPDFVLRVIEEERVDALLPTLGGQTALNTAFELARAGHLERLGVEMLGATADVIARAEDRELFKQAMIEIGLDVPRSGTARTFEEARAVQKSLGFPVIIRPSFTLGGSGGGIAYNAEEFEEIAARGLDLSMISEILLEESVIGWKEFELEVMRDCADNCVVICSIENIDPMGVHTGDSVTVAPIQTLTDREYQRMRNAAFAVIRRVGVETGGSNIQFAVDPRTGRMIVIEMNPRVSRSSALASKATGFPIAKIAAKLAVGYTLDEIRNDITRETPASFEPSIDYCVVKIPRFAFDKFPDADPTLTTQMKSVGEVMAIGRTFAEALQKAMRSLERGRHGLGLSRSDRALNGTLPGTEEIRKNLIRPNAERLEMIRYAFLAGMTVEDVHELTAIDPWFLGQIRRLVAIEERLRGAGGLEALDPPLLATAKRNGFSDRQIAAATGTNERTVRRRREDLGVRPVYRRVDTCAAEFEAFTPYFYSTWGEEDEVRPTDRRKIMILGSGPNRIGQGIEFDYCCVHAAYALREMGFETIMVNSNPETVSTDYDTSDRLYFEPLTFEDVLSIYERERPEGVIVQLGGQTPLNLASDLARAGVRILGTSPDSIDRAEDRERFKEIVERLRLRQPESEMATSPEGAVLAARRLGYPVLVRPSYVLGGRAMEIVYDDDALRKFAEKAVEASEERPILVDRFIEHAVEIDVDAVSDGTRSVIGGIMEHIEEAGIHSGDSTCVLPPFSLSDKVLARLRDSTTRLAAELGVCGLMNIQYAIRGDEVYVLEVNPRASRTVPFVSKAIGVPLAKIAAVVMAGRSLADAGFTEERVPVHVSVKQPVFPFSKFPGCDIILGPEMRSTGEAMGVDSDMGAAFAKSWTATGHRLPASGMVFLSVKDSDKRSSLPLAQRLHDLGFTVLATEGTCKVLRRGGVPAVRVLKIAEGRPNITDHLKNREVKLVINTPSGKGPRTDEASIRGLAVAQGIPCITTLSGAEAALAGIEAQIRQKPDVRAIHDYHAAMKSASPAPGTP